MALPIFCATAQMPSTFSSTLPTRKKFAEVDRDRADFIRHYFGKQWPHRPLYNIVINSKFGDEFVIESILQNREALEKHQSLRDVTV